MYWLVMGLGTVELTMMPMPRKGFLLWLFGYLVSRGVATPELDKHLLRRRPGDATSTTVNNGGRPSTFLRLDNENFMERDLQKDDYRMWTRLLQGGSSMTPSPTRSPVTTPVPPTMPPVPGMTPAPTRIPTLRPTPTPSVEPSTAVPTLEPEDCGPDGECNENCSIISPDPDCPEEPPDEPRCEPAISPFDDGDEGWTITGDAQGGLVEPSWLGQGGNPGGYIFAVDDVAGGVWRFQAPQKFHGDFSGAYGNILSFDLRQSGIDDQFSSRDVIIEGGGSLIWFDTPNNPGVDWTPYAIPLVEGAGWRRNNNEDATEEEIRNVLSSIEDIQIRGEYRTGDDAGGLDNVRLDSFCAPTFAPTGQPASLFDLFLVNANDDLVIQPLINGQIIQLDRFPGDITFSILADADDSTTSSVQWILSNAETGELVYSFQDDDFPYTLGGEVGDNILPVSELLEPGRYRVTAIPINAGGVAGVALTRTFSVVDNFDGGSGSTRGTEFWVVELPNLDELPVDDPGDFGIVIVNTAQIPADIEIIHIESQTVQTFTIPAGGVEVVTFPRRGVAESGITTTPTYRILADAEVVVYAFAPLNDVRSNDATTILPTSSLGTTYRVLSYQSPTDNFVGTMYAIAATEDNTSVQVFDTAGNLVDDAILDAGETLQRIEEFDMSGYQIVASNPVAVFSGSRCTAAGSSNEFCDILYEQVLPEQALGSTYLSCPTLTRPTGCEDTSCAVDIFRYLAIEGGTTIDYAGTTTVLGEGEIAEFATNEPHVVTSSGPIYAYQVLVSFGSGPIEPATGDPAIVQIPPVEQFQFEYVIYTPSTFPNNFLHVMAPNGMTLTIDGVVTTVDCSGDVAGTIDGVDYCCEVFETAEGAHVIEGNQAFGLYATGFDDFSQFGYIGGTGVEAISSGCVTGGPYLVAACSTPATTTLAGDAVCSDGSVPLVFWSTPDITLGFVDVSSLSTSVNLNAFGSFVICLDVVCGSTSTQCCSSIDVMEMAADGSACP